MKQQHYRDCILLFFGEFRNPNMKTQLIPVVDVSNISSPHEWRLRSVALATIVQELYDFSRNKLQQKVSQRFLVNRGVLYDILKV